MKYFKYKIIPFIIIGILGVSCANISLPTGGAEDRTPPKFLSAHPPQGTLNFKEDLIHLYFDEYLYLNNIYSELICSPPFEKRPEVKLQGKRIQITFHEDLKPDLTYRLYFGNAITDNNERNVLPNFSYIFSTGNYLDTMFVEGHVFNAFSLKPEQNTLVLLYMDYQDSVVSKESPYYVSRTDSSGHFALYNLQNKPFKILALKDLNGNLKYDLPTEEVAFLTDLVTPQYISPNDSTSPKPIEQKLFMFLPEKEEIQQVRSASFIQDKGHLLITARQPFISPEITISSPMLRLPFLTELSTEKDSLHIWVQDTVSIDTLLLVLKDPQGKLADTSLRITRDIPSPSKARQGKKNIMSANIQSTQPFFVPLELSFTDPLYKIDSIEAIQVIHDEDTLFAGLNIADTIKRKIHINFPFKEGEKYQITIIGGKFIDIYGQTNDTLKISTRIDSQEDYGDMVFTFEPEEVKCQFIVQLTDDKENIKDTYIVKDTTTLSFNHLAPGNYRIKIIEDANCNNKWDSGNYWTKQQPETVRLFPKAINIRANWILEESYKWEILVP